MDVIPAPDPLLCNGLSVSDAHSPTKTVPTKASALRTARLAASTQSSAPHSTKLRPLVPGLMTPPRTPASTHSPRTPKKKLNPENLPETRKIDQGLSPSSSVKIKLSNWLHRPRDQTSSPDSRVRRDIDSSWAVRSDASPVHTYPSPPAEKRHAETTLLVRKRDLIHRVFNSKVLRWDVKDSPADALSVKPDSTFARVPSCVLAEPALCPNVLRAEIHLLESSFWDLERKWGSITLRRRHPSQPMTVCDVMQAIYAYFHIAVTQSDLDVLAPSQHDRLVLQEAWRERNLNAAKKTPFAPCDTTIRRVDFLQDKSKFWKLRVGSLQGASCQLFLSLR